MPVDINSLTEGWLELESDPGLFTLLLEDFGVNDVQVEEIYDLQKSLDDTVYGFIFLFRWTEERRSRRKIVDQSETFVKDEEVVNSIFFAQQIVPNSCATHALLSVLLNCPNISLGDTLSRLKAHTTGMCPENKGWAIGNTPELAKAHNSHAMPQARRCVDKLASNVSIGSTGRYTPGETFHFVSYVPIQGRLYELDGLKPYPIDHGPWGEKESWTEKFRRVITDRLESANGEQAHDIRFNLMAVVPDRRIALTHRLSIFKTNKQIVSGALQRLVKLKTTGSKEEVERVKEEKKEEEILNGIKTETQKSPLEKDKNNSESSDVKNINGISKDSDSFLLQKPILESRALSKLVDMPESCQNHVEGSSSLDYSTPLTVQTSPAPSCSSTDTSSEVGSAFNSPTQGWGWNSGQSSPMSTKDFKKLVVVQMSATPDFDGNHPGGAAIRKRGPMDISTTIAKKAFLDVSPQGDNSLEGTVEKKSLDSKLHCKYPGVVEPHTFAPNDIVGLLKNLEHEIRTCEVSIREENEKRKQYKIDDCRRTHNYDDFICTFLSMLAQQGMLADLVQQHLIHNKKPGLPMPRVNRVVKKTTSHPTPRRRRARAKCRRRK
ncbi:unnamed protein product [Timema podura]|uniref:Ubiquitin carboxyl-terminal hydrolase n=1 Tax=Timema podura TaxID=61482 RepID=A0ABN7P4Y2_TIMPD|nr:unnamed protein product [Timema podura]